MQTKILLLVITLSFLYFQKSNAQTSDTNQSETILKINPRTGTPFTKGQLRWFDNSGFDTQNYNWQNSEVNAKLNASIKIRNASLALGGVAATFALAGLLSNTVGDMADMQDKKDNAQQTSNRLLLFSGIALTATICLSIGSSSEAKKANKLRVGLPK